MEILKEYKLKICDGTAVYVGNEYQSDYIYALIKVLFDLNQFTFVLLLYYSAILFTFPLSHSYVLSLLGYVFL